jgi:hypothetical protein
VSEIADDDKDGSAVHYFVDEAGDDVLFGARGTALVGTPGCSKCFIIGALMVADPEALASDLSTLRESLLADPYFKDVPSMQPSRRKTALAFHAKDDVPEVRREVFRVLLKHEMKFFAVVRQKTTVLAYVRERNLRDTEYRYRPTDLYDTTVARVFKDRLHVVDMCNVTFAQRGRSDRTRAFQTALETARGRFEAKWQRKVDSAVNVVVSTPAKTIPLQAADYALWALQRFYDLGEDRYLQLLWQKVSLIHAVDERERNAWGTYYTKKKPPFTAV